VATLPELSVTDWAVLGALSSGASHGFAAARLLAPGGEIGRVWTVSRPLVYRSLIHLAAEGLVSEEGTAPGAAGPRRRVVSPTRRGERALAAYLVSPVAHVRDYRSELMLKLLLLDGRPEEKRTLLRAQRTSLAPMCAGLALRLEQAEGFEAVLARWRLDSALAALRFLEGLGDREPRAPGR